MSDEAVAAVETPEAPAAQTEYKPEARSFAAVVQAHAARMDAARAEPAAEEAAEPEEKPAAEVKPPIPQAPKPPKNGNGARKAYFEAQKAKAQAEQSTAQAQTAEQRLATLEREVAEARSGMDEARVLFEKGDFDGALKKINARGIDGFESLQKRVLAAYKDAPADDPRVEEIKAELEALKQERDAEKRAKAEAEQRDQETKLKDSVFAAVCELTSTSEDPDVRRLSAVPGFNQAVHTYSLQYENASEEDILNVAKSGFLDVEKAFYASRGLSEAQISAIMNGKVPGDLKTEAKAAPPARRSANVETTKVDKPSQHKPTVTISTNAAESTHTGRKWDPKSRNQAWDEHKRSYNPGR
jgi:hypothetical protein